MTPSSAYLRQAVGAMPRNSLLVIFIGKNFHFTGKRINALAALSYQHSKLRAFAMANHVSDETHLLKWMRQTGGRVAATRQAVEAQRHAWIHKTIGRALCLLAFVRL